MNLLRREKNLRDLRNKIARYEVQRDAALKAIVRMELALPILKRALCRQESALGLAVIREVIIRTKDDKGPATIPAVNVEVMKIEDDIPTFLDRRAEVQAEVDAEKKRKADVAAEKRAVKKEHIQAELTGKKRKMPLAGKDALAAIRDGG